MANPPGSLSFADLDDRFKDSLMDSTVASATRYRYLQDAYVNIWYMKPWDFRRAVASLSVSAGVSEYQLDAQCDLPVAAFNDTEDEYISMNKGFFHFWNNYSDNIIDGTPQDIIDFRSVNGDNLIVLGQTPSSANGHGDVISYYFYKHITHNTSAGSTATGNMSVSTDVPSFDPQFHRIIVAEALLLALKDKRQFSEMYQSVQRERAELLKSMMARHCTPSRNINQVRVIR